MKQSRPTEKNAYIRIYLCKIGTHFHANERRCVSLRSCQSHPYLRHQVLPQIDVKYIYVSAPVAVPDVCFKTMIFLMVLVKYIPQNFY